jgi:hypothetical protein
MLRLPFCQMRAVPIRTVAALLAVCALAGCGAVSASSALSDAQRGLEEARAQQADEFAPYDYTRADAFYQKAKACNGMGQYQIAASYARTSQDAATKSLDVAKANKEQAARRKKFAPTQDGKSPAPVRPN